MELIEYVEENGLKNPIYGIRRIPNNDLEDLFIRGRSGNIDYGFYSSTLGIKKVIFHDPATIVYWKDGTKTVVKCSKDDTYSKEAGLAFCVMKKLYGNGYIFHEIFKKYCKEEE